VLLCVGCAGKLDSNRDFFAAQAGEGGRRAPATLASGESDAGMQPAELAGGRSAWGAGAPAAEGGAGAPVQAAADGGGGAAGPSQGGRAGQRACSGAGSGGAELSGTCGVADGGSAAGAGAAAGSGGETAAKSCDFRALMQERCGSASCHGAPASSTGLDLTSAMPAQRLQGRSGSGTCSDKLLIDPAQPEQSKLYLKVSGASCGVRMPLGGSLTASEEACVLTWIEAL